MTGSGTESDPYVIYNQTDLQNIANDLDAYYVLGNDITCSGHFIPIGYRSYPFSYPFSGVLDGREHIIRNLYIDTANSDGYSAFFGAAENATIKNIIFKNSYVKILLNGYKTATVVIGNKNYTLPIWGRIDRR